MFVSAKRGCTPQSCMSAPRPSSDLVLLPPLTLSLPYLADFTIIPSKRTNSQQMSRCCIVVQSSLSRSSLTQHLYVTYCLASLVFVYLQRLGDNAIYHASIATVCILMPRLAD